MAPYSLVNRELFLSLDLADPVVYEEKPADFDRGPLQDHPMWKENLFVLTVGLIPIYLQYASYKIWPGVYRFTILATLCTDDVNF